MGGGFDDDRVNDACISSFLFVSFALVLFVFVLVSPVSSFFFTPSS